MVLSANDAGYRQCSMSVMDNIADPNISFDEQGICNYYYEYKEAEKKLVLKGEAGEKKVAEIVAMLKESGKGKKYDCILGVSGGVDSSYLAYWAAKNQLRALCVHFDNGWNSELAVKNIEEIVKKCSFELFTYVIGWHEFKDIQLAYFKAHVVDIEAITDIAIIEAVNQISAKFNVRYVLSGNNIVTEQTLPLAWINKNPNNLFQVHKIFGEVSLENYPVSFKDGKYVPVKGNYVSVCPLNYLEYNKDNVKKILVEELGWRDYGGKHYESVFTRFYQGFILPQKFKIDKRKAHLSNLIFSGQIDKEYALKELSKPAYPDDLLRTDREFVLKKLNFTEQQFESYLSLPAIPHSFYGGEPNKGSIGFLGKKRMQLGKVKQKLKESFRQSKR